VSYLERNYRLIKERMIQQMENSIALGRKLIDTELDTGLLNFIVKPIIKAFYDYWSQNDAKEGTLKQIKVTLDAGKKLVIDGNSDEVFDEVLKEHLPKYIEADQTTRQCDKRHKNYEEIVNVARETFINYLNEVVKLLDVKEDVDDYGDLCRVAFKTKEVAEQNLTTQLKYTDEGIKIVEKDPSILKILVGRKIIVKALRKGFEKTKEEFIKSLNDTYNQK
jgi:hypothetical protein